MPHKFSPQNIERLMRRDRLGGITAEGLLKGAGLKKGMTFADIGCGPGFFVIPASGVVGKKGTVYAVDMQDEMLAELKKRISGRTNIIPVKSGEHTMPVGGKMVDFALMAYVLHETESKPLFLKEVRRVLKDGGKVLLLDWEKKVEDHGPPFEERIRREDAVTLLKGAGFEITRESSLDPSHYRLEAMKV
ncbi:MAG: methyltransferase domain-containing protein [Deltaproteobacteria bacterium]|nr:methyltransferase domain-containing protein [Deltaproteobacteria bacterium]